MAKRATSARKSIRTAEEPRRTPRKSKAAAAPAEAAPTEEQQQAQQDARDTESAAVAVAAKNKWHASYQTKRAEARKSASAPGPATGQMMGLAQEKPEGLVTANTPSENIARDPYSDVGSAVPDATAGWLKPTAATGGPQLPQTSEYGGQMPAVNAFEAAAERGIPSFGTGRLTDALAPNAVVGSAPAGEDSASVSSTPPSYEKAREAAKS